MPLTSGDVVVRPMVRDDAATVAEYCNDPEVARFQDWELPVSEDETRARFSDPARKQAPTPGAWVTFGVDYQGALAGEIGVGLDPTGGVASLGYTLATAFQGRGIASTAARLVIEQLFSATAVHRIEATIDPLNWPSARVLEGLGFRYEGRRHSAVRVRGEWCDDDAYELLRADWQLWNNRPRHSPTDVRLAEISAANREQVAQLATHHSQERFVAPMARSFMQALIPDHVDGEVISPWMRAVVADGEIVAFVMMVEPTPAHPDPYLWRLLIDRLHQRRGIGSAVLRLLIDELRRRGERALTVSYGLGTGSPERFYQRHGFVPTGEKDGTEVRAILQW